MIYTVELNFSDSDRADEWNAWYETYLAQLVRVPGLDTAQRFRAVTPGAQTWDYLAIYSIRSLDLFASEAYLSIGGGGNASFLYKDAISRRRNVYDGIERFPQITAESNVVFCEDAPYGFDLDDILFQPLTAAADRRKAGATELDGAPVRRTIAVTSTAVAARHDLVTMDGAAVYAPFTKRHTSANLGSIGA